MHMLARTLWHLMFVGSRGPRLRVEAVSRSHFRVWPTDLDVLRHMNNGKYLSIMDVARFDLMQRNGVLAVFKREGWYPVVVGQTISYRKSLNPWKRFTIESKIIGFDEQAVYLEQRFVRPDRAGASEIYARAFVRARILRRGSAQQRSGVVGVDEIIEKTGADRAAFQVPDQILAWGRSTRLPSTRDAAPSSW
ncbi:MAG: thioesterase family protein [Actinobacteria bacterium]|nr:thioesterase family protein [Actinomycetota bacterium]